jgi:MFS family permease
MTYPGRPAGARSDRRGRLGFRYQRLLVATGASALGDGLVLVAFPLLAVTLTTRPILIAGVAAAGQLPWLLVSLPAGALADRVNRRRLLAVVEVTRAAALLALGLIVITGHDSLTALYVAAFVIGALETAFSAAIKALLPALVEVEVLARANGYLFVADTAGEQFAGPALGGMAFAWSPAVPFLGDALSYVASAVLLTSVLPSRPSQGQAPPSGRLRADVAFGLRWFLTHPLLRLLALVVATFAFCQAVVMSVLVLYGVRVLHLGKPGYGFFLAAGAVGSLVGGLLAGPIHARLGPGKAIIIAGVSAAVGYLLLGSTSHVLVAVLALAVEAVSVAIGNVVTLSLRQVVIPSELLGRVNNAFRTCVFATMPLGALAGGALAASLGVRATFVAAGAIQAGAVAVVGRRITRRITVDNARRHESVGLDHTAQAPPPA